LDKQHHGDRSPLSRRAFLKASAAVAGMGLSFAPHPALAAAFTVPDPDKIFCGIQIATHSVLDEGIDYCLDLLGEQAAVNAVLFNAFSYYGAMGRPKEVQGDHGRPLLDNSKRKLTQIWVQPHDHYYVETALRHSPADPAREYAGRDVFHELAEPCKKRGMKLYVRWYEPASDFIPVENWKSVLFEDAEGKRGKRPCWNHPDYRAFIAATMWDLFENYPLDGIQYGVERPQPLTETLFLGAAPHCFCSHCQGRARREGIDLARVKTGALALSTPMRGIIAGTLKPTDGVLVEVMRVFFHYPELLAWERQWRLAGEEVNQLVLKTVKTARPGAVVGRFRLPCLVGVGVGVGVGCGVGLLRPVVRRVAPSLVMRVDDRIRHVASGVPPSVARGAGHERGHQQPHRKPNDGCHVFLLPGILSRAPRREHASTRTSRGGPRRCAGPACACRFGHWRRTQFSGTNRVGCDGRRGRRGCTCGQHDEDGGSGSWRRWSSAPAVAAST
jgi:hypothetical protein